MPTIKEGLLCIMQHQKQHKTWCVIITKPKSEKKVASQLQLLGIEAFCPTRKEVRQWSDRKKKGRCSFIAFHGFGQYRYTRA